jgi:hypothetical protein
LKLESIVLSFEYSNKKVNNKSKKNTKNIDLEYSRYVVNKAHKSHTSDIYIEKYIDTIRDALIILSNEMSISIYNLRKKRAPNHIARIEYVTSSALLLIYSCLLLKYNNLY